MHLALQLVVQKVLDLLVFVEMFEIHVFSFLAVFSVPELFRELRETRGIHFHLLSSIYVFVVPSYDHLSENYNEY